MDYDKKIEILYNQVLAERKEYFKHPENKLDPLSKKILAIGTKLENMSNNLYLIWSNPNTVMKEFDVLQKNFIKLLDKVMMFFDPGVVDRLVNEYDYDLAKKKMLDKM